MSFTDPRQVFKDIQLLQEVAKQLASWKGESFPEAVDRIVAQRRADFHALNQVAHQNSELIRCYATSGNLLDRLVELGSRIEHGAGHARGLAEVTSDWLGSVLGLIEEAKVWQDRFTSARESEQVSAHPEELTHEI